MTPVPLPTEEIERIDRLHKAATPPPWHQIGSPWSNGSWVSTGNGDPHTGAMVCDFESVRGEREVAREAGHADLAGADDDAAFVAAVRNAWPGIKAEIEAGRAGAERVRGNAAEIDLHQYRVDDPDEKIAKAVEQVAERLCDRLVMGSDEQDIGIAREEVWALAHMVGEIAAPRQAALPSPERYRHRKRGTTYQLIADSVSLQTDEPLLDMALVTIYRAEVDGTLWVRRTRDFRDGRFERIGGTEAAQPAGRVAICSECCGSGKIKHGIGYAGYLVTCKQCGGSGDATPPASGAVDACSCNPAAGEICAKCARGIR